MGGTYGGDNNVNINASSSNITIRGYDGVNSTFITCNSQFFFSPSSIEVYSSFLSLTLVNCTLKSVQLTMNSCVIDDISLQTPNAEFVTCNFTSLMESKSYHMISSNISIDYYQAVANITFEDCTFRNIRNQVTPPLFCWFMLLIIQ